MFRFLGGLMLLVASAIVALPINEIWSTHRQSLLHGPGGAIQEYVPPELGWGRDAIVAVDLGGIPNEHVYFVVVRLQSGKVFPQMELSERGRIDVPVQLGRRRDAGGSGDVGATFEVLLLEVWGTTLTEFRTFLTDISRNPSVAAQGVDLSAPRFSSSWEQHGSSLWLTREQA